MKLLVVGGGGREHAIIKKLKQNPAVEKIYALPGNGGMEEAECVGIGAKEIPAIVRFAVDHGVDYAVVAPDDPLVLGAVDALEEAGVPCFGPRANAAIIEGSKVFSKNLMKKYGIPTARFETFDNAEDALDYLRAASYPIVIKADGLALGALPSDLFALRAHSPSNVRSSPTGKSKKAPYGAFCFWLRRWDLNHTTSGL